ncbi:MAG TPA: GntR family transcriptional regulator [Thermotogota bacterium]|nr:GntR family transcriptional regulator [Thermotogota bacterium]HPX96831.1 GntR family transcriptional regulator [Thermotogota bacterium]
MLSSEEIPIENNYLLPKHKQISAMLLERIREGEYAVGSRLPSERELSGRYGVSRMTARQALMDLIDRGYANAEKGKGTFVQDPRINNDLNNLQGFSYMVKSSRGLEATSRVLEAKETEADSVIAARLKITIGTRIHSIRRVRIVDGFPVAVEQSYTPAMLLPDLLQYDFAVRSLFGTIREVYHIRLTHSWQEIGIVYSDSHTAMLLEVPKNEALFLFKSITFTDGDIPVEYCEGYVRSDKCHFTTIAQNVEF